MNTGKAFELFVKRILIWVGFSEVSSDGLYIYDGAAGQMIQGLGETHNADVLLEPPVQTPFYYKTRLLVECKNYKAKVGLNTLRSALGLREDVNHFEPINPAILRARRQQNRRTPPPVYERYTYQVAVASWNGFTAQAQAFAAAYRISLIEFNRLPFWPAFCDAFARDQYYQGHIGNRHVNIADTTETVAELAEQIGRRMAVAITNSGQMLFLYHTTEDTINFDEEYMWHWECPEQPWTLRSGEDEYLFQLPKDIMKIWLNSSTNELELKREAIYCKENHLSSMLVYFRKYNQPMVKMITVNRWELERARAHLENPNRI